jgi:ABC-type branched-subunit amino acid transport system ATPase component
MQTKLIIRNLSKSFGEARVIRSADLEVSNGEIVGLIGPNGAGKTTLLNAICGTILIDGGTRLFGEVDLARLSPHRIAQLGIGRLFQDVRLFPRATVLDNVLIGFRAQLGEHLWGALFAYSRVASNEERNVQAALQIFETLGIKLPPDAPAVTLSYGEQKLVALARLLALDAKLLLVDEVAAGLSASMRHNIAKLLRQLSEGNRGIILSEHDLTFVSETCTRVCILSEGRILTTDSPKEILKSGAIRRLLYGV